MNDIITLTGNAGADAVLTPTKSGVSFASFRLATTFRRRGADDQVHETTTWYRVVAFRELADHVAQSVHRGDPMLVTGRLRISEWEHEGVTRTSVEVVADAIGHNLRWGSGSFTRAGRASTAGTSDAPESASANVDADGWALVGAANEPPAEVPF